MKRIFFYTVMIFFLGCGTHKKETIKVSEAEFKQATTAFVELNELLMKENGTLWSYKLNGPILLANKDSRIFITNENNNNDFVKKGDYFIGKLPENIIISNTAIDWDGKRWTMVGLPLPELKEARMSLMIHESFHRIQPKIGFESLYEIQNNHLDTKDGRIYLKLELEALKQALNSDKPKQHIKNALLFRQFRHQLFPGSLTSENSLELNEGLAEYTGSILGGMGDADLQKHYSIFIDGFLARPTFVRSFAYATIPVYGYFMRQTEKNWNLKINSKTNLTEFISNFFGIKPQNLNLENIKKIGESYNFESIGKFEENREVKQIKLIEMLKKRFLGDSTFVIVFENMNIGYNPCNIIPLDTFGLVYPNLRVTDNWGILEVDSCGALVSNWVKVTITAPTQTTDTLISGKGWKLKLNSSWKLEKVNSHYNLNRK